MCHSGPVHDTRRTDELDCPRCGSALEQEYYGPCTSCRTALRLRYAGDEGRVIDVDYEPKMNVRPNAVALKDD